VNSNVLDAHEKRGLATEPCDVATSAVLRGCEASCCTLQGLRVEGNAKVRAEACTLLRNGQGGVVVLSGGRLIVDGCATKGNKDAGTLPLHVLLLCLCAGTSYTCLISPVQYSFVYPVFVSPVLSLNRSRTDGATPVNLNLSRDR
jgi:hypothetical protein